MFYSTRRFACLIAVAICAGTAAQSQDVTLRTGDGSLEVTGTLLEYDGEFYRINTNIGELTVDGHGVDCLGNGCPDLIGFVSAFTISGSRLIGADLIPALIEEHSFTLGRDLVRNQMSADHSAWAVSDKSGLSLANILVSLSNTAKGFADLVASDADITMAFRTANLAEQAMVQDAGLGDVTGDSRRHILALDGLVLVVHADNPVQSISLENAAAVFSGEITNWQALGGPDSQIRRYRGSADADLGQFFAAEVLDRFDRTFAAAHIFPDYAELSDAVSSDPQAIGFTNFANTRNARPLSIRWGCGFLSKPSAFSIKTEDYPLTRRLYLYTPKRRLPVYARSFLGFLDTAAAESVVANIGFVGQAVIQRDWEQQGDRLANAIRESGGDVKLDELQRMIEALGHASRLSVSFRFNDGELALDERSIVNVTLLGHMIEVGDFDDREVMIVGFSDSGGSGSGNRSISLKRAKIVRDAIRKAAPKADLTQVTFRTLGFGELSPLGCNDDAAGQRMNRRVEVWIK